MTEEIKTLQYLKRKNQGLFKRLKLLIKQRLGWLGVPKVIPYRGYGTATQVFFTGFLTEDKGLAKPGKDQTVWENVLAMLKRYSSDEIPGAKVQLSFEGAQRECFTSNAGLFTAIFEREEKEQKPNSQWLDYQVKLLGDWDAKENELTESGELLIPGSNSEFGVISDIDDTILVSHSTQVLRKLRLMLLRNSRTRKPFPGVGAFYQALSQGYDGKGTNPFFYVSSSEWNLYDLLDDFCSYNKLPKGVFLLRDLQSSIYKFWKSGGGNHEHKYKHIKKLFEVYPELSFVLIGDNGQQDPEIYSKIAHEHPKQVKAIYIRTIRKRRNDRRMNELAQELNELEVPFILTKDTVEAADHAASGNLIRKEMLDFIRRDAEGDRKWF